MAVWTRITEQRSGFLYDLSESLAIIDWRYPNVLVPVADGAMVIVSDYSGQHRLARHESYLFLVTTGRSLNDWLVVRREFRNRWLPDGRRISFKDLREPVRYRALLPFLKAASAIPGNVLTFLVDRRIASFIEGGAAALVEGIPECFPRDIRPATAEKMYRLASFVC
jgi:hypothetical protein